VAAAVADPPALLVARRARRGGLGHPTAPSSAANSEAGRERWGHWSGHAGESPAWPSL